MYYLSYITQDCAEMARRYGLASQVDELARKLEDDQAIRNWDRFVKPYVKKSLGRSYRLVAEERVVGDVLVVCFVAVFPKGSHDYDEFLETHTLSNVPSPSDADLAAFVDECGETIRSSLPPISSIEAQYLYDRLPASDDGLGTVYESKDWISAVLAREEALAWYYELLHDALNSPEAESTLKRRGSAMMLYRFDPSIRRLFLAAALRPEDVSLEQKYRERYRQVFEAPTLDDGTLLRLSGRAYPALALAGEEIWFRIQKNAEGNLALSTEEMEILSSVRSPSGPESRVYPLLINGRPGSGKSTILQYLFAEHLYLHLRRPPSERSEAPPIYLTYSEKLLQWAQTSVRTLLETYAPILAEGAPLSDGEIAEAVVESFGVFHTFLQRLLPADRREYFRSDRRIDFPKFQRLWHSKFPKSSETVLRRLSPEIAWHVIRTYIKGTPADVAEYLAPEAYLELAEKRRWVQLDTYKLVFNRVWEGWYKDLCASHGYWDDQDLAREVLALDRGEISRYPVVFCDEAQDFTRAELELITRLSLFSRRSVPPQQLKMIPIAFAGDPFQTLNPTGFDWTAAQADFYENVVAELDRSQGGRLQFNYQELSYNYRSTRHVVGFCNFVQLLRGVLFDINQLKPQRTWFDEDSPMPTLYDSDDDACQRMLEEQAELVIILPCQEGEEREYIKNDSLLSRLASSEVRNFLSPMSAKGLEFSRVVLYKFGDECAEGYPNLLVPLETGKPHTAGEAALPLQYFVNRLYVAASRPKRRLFIVDTKKGIEKLWNSRAVRAPEDLLRRYHDGGNPGWQADDLSFVQPGRAVSTDDRDDSARLAEQFLQEGRAKGDPYKLLLAAANFRRAGRHQDAQRTEALRAEVEGRAVEAGELYLELGETDDALRCFWKARAYNKIAKVPEFENSAEHQAAAFMTAPISAPACRTFLGYLADAARTPLRRQMLAADGWTSVVKELAERLASIEPGELDWKRVYAQLQELREVGLDVAPTGALARIAYRASEYKDALRIWDAMPSPPIKDRAYVESRARTESFPDNLRWFSELGDPQAVVAAYEIHAGKRLPADQAADVALAYSDLGRPEKAAQLVSQVSAEQALERLVERWRREEKRDLATTAAAALIRVRAESDRWMDALGVVSKARIPKPEREKLDIALTRALAFSQSSALDGAVAIQNALADHLKAVFLDGRWPPTANVRVVGAAFERAGRIISALEFYEAIWRQGRIGAPADIPFARERWLRSKLRQAEHAEHEGNTPVAGRYREEAKRSARQWGIELSAIPTYPKLRDEESPSSEEPPTMIVSDEDRTAAILALSRAGTPIEKIAALLTLSEDIVRRALDNGTNGG